MYNLHHKHICSIYGYSINTIVSTTPDVKLVMKYVAGGSLEQFLERNPNLSYYEIIRYCLQAARAVNYLHSHCTDNHHDPILHRDLKSANVLVDGERNEKSQLLLTDFGESNFQSQVTNTSTGTLSFRAPETLGENPTWSEKADIYSLGMLFYEIGTSQRPYRDIEGNSHKLFNKIKARNLPPFPINWFPVLKFGYNRGRLTPCSRNCKR